MNIGQLSAKLNAFTDRLIENVKQAQMDTAFDIQIDMYNNAPEKTGVYKDTIMVYEQEVTPDTISVEIGTDYKVQTLEGNSYLLGELLESGTRPHDIWAVNKKALSDGVTIFGKHVNHPRNTSTATYITSIK